MNQMVLKSRIGSDGVLRVTLPIGQANANSEVRVIIEPISKRTPSQAEWERWVDSISGSWEGDLQRPPQGDFEAREPFE